MALHYKIQIINFYSTIVESSGKKLAEDEKMIQETQIFWNCLVCSIIYQWLYISGWCSYCFWLSLRHTQILSNILTLKTLFFQDWLDIDFGIAEGVDFIAISFVKSAEVIKHLKSYIKARAREKWVKILIKALTSCCRVYDK